MSANSKNTLSVIISTTLFFFAPLASYGNSSGDPIGATCDGDECSLTLDDRSEVGHKLCQTSLPVVFWTAGSRYYLIQCGCNCTMQSNSNWVVDKEKRKLYGFSYGRLFNRSYIEQATTATEVPDRFADVKLCEAPHREKVKSSIFILLKKLPDEKIAPYCYEVTYITEEDGHLAISNNYTQISKSDDDYWISKIPAKQKDIIFAIVDSIQRHAGRYEFREGLRAPRQ